MALRLYKSMAHEAEQDHLEVDVASEITCYAQSVHSTAVHNGLSQSVCVVFTLGLVQWPVHCR